MHDSSKHSRGHNVLNLVLKLEGKNSTQFSLNLEKEIIESRDSHDSKKYF